MQKKLIVSTRKGLLIYNLVNGEWLFDTLHFKGIPVSLSHYDGITKTLWSFEDHGHWGVKMHKTTDWGANWEEVSAPVYPDDAILKGDFKASLTYIWAANSVRGNGTSKLFLGTDPGGLFTSIDDGASFKLNQSLWNQESRMEKWFGGGRVNPGIHSIVIHPDNPHHIYIGISCAGVFETKDGGQNWFIRNNGLRADFLPDPYAEVGHDPHLLLACKSQPEFLWQQNHCGIFKSENGGLDWIEVSEKDGPANFGFAIAVDDQDPNTAWVVPCISDEIRVAVDEALCVCKTTDGGLSWTAHRKGLPQVNCYDIVYRHSLKASGNDLVFGTTTGNLFHSNDGGESWNTISNYLAMVYAVEIVEMNE